MRRNAKSEIVDSDEDKRKTEADSGITLIALVATIAVLITIARYKSTYVNR